MGDSERAVRRMELCWLFCVLNVYFTALHETGQMKDIRRVTHAVKMVDSLFESKWSSVRCNMIMVIVPSRRERVEKF